MPVAIISDDSFDSEVLAANKPVIVDFWAEWCGPCKQVSAHFEALADEIELPVQVSGKTRSKVSVARNATEADAKAAALADPTVRRFTDGKEITKVIYVPNRLLNIVVAG